jgi:hypothetical protein
LAEGAILTPSEFLHLGTRAAVHQALSRLARVGLLMRPARGLYVVPISTRFGVRPPGVQQTVQSLAQSTRETITEGGGWAANSLGLTT